MQLLVVAAACSVLGCVIAAVFWTQARFCANLGGWLLSGIATIALLGAYGIVDADRATQRLYSAHPRTVWMRWAILAVGVVGVGLNAWWLGEWASYRWKL